MASSHDSNLELALNGAKFVAVSASGFPVSVLLIWVLLLVISEKKKKRQREVGDFGKFMIALEAIGMAHTHTHTCIHTYIQYAMSHACAVVVVHAEMVCML
jgi:hypothetical protein